MAGVSVCVRGTTVGLSVQNRNKNPFETFSNIIIIQPRQLNVREKSIDTAAGAHSEHCLFRMPE